MLTLDVETRSTWDLRECGGWNYSRHMSTDVLVLCYSIDNGPIIDLDMSVNKECPLDVRDYVHNGGIVNAFNTSFEYSIWKHILHERHGWPMPEDHCWRDTSAVCLANGFPDKLETAAVALKFTDGKDSRGKALINFFSMPVSSGLKKGVFRQPAEHAARFKEFIEYCHQDVKVTLDIEAALPPLSENELEFWLATWNMNLRGIAVDMALVNALSQLCDTSRSIIGESLDSATGGQITIKDIQNHGKILRFVQSSGVACTSVAKKSVTAMLTDIPEGASKTVLEARQALGKTSVAKLDAIKKLAGEDGRIRFGTVAHGAATGRDAARGVQIQNLPRGGKYDVSKLIAAALRGDTDDFLANSYPTKGKRIFDPMGAIVTCLRSCFVASVNKVLVQCDWSSVEPRKIAWLSGEKALLDDFKRVDASKDVDIYQVTAAPFFGLDPKEMIGDFRQFGKVYVLQNIYGSSWVSVQRSAKDQYGLVIDEDTARLCVDVFRGTYRNIVAFWSNLEKAAKCAILAPNHVVRCGMGAFCFDGTHLRFRLPSGRKITYPYASLKLGMTTWGTEQEQIYYYGVGQSRQWMEFSLYGSQIANHATQGSCACLMRAAVVKLDKLKIDVVLRAHDELVCDVDTEDKANILKDVMLTLPTWAKDLPLNGAGWTGPRFKKD